MSNKILYVEDNVVQAEMVKYVLTEKNFEVTHAEDGLCAKALLLSDRFDIIVTDHYMPHMTGLELMGHIRSFDNETPIIFLSSCEELKVATEALKQGADDFILKDRAGEYYQLIGSVIQKTIEKSQLKSRVKELKQKVIDEQSLSHITLNSLSQGVVILDTQLNVVFTNNFFNECFGFSASEGQDCADLKALSQRFSQEGGIEGLFDAVQIQSVLELWLLDREGVLEMSWRDKHFELSKSRLSKVGFSVTLTDVSAQKAQLKSLSHIIDFSPVCMFVVDVFGKVQRANREACAFYGFEQDQMYRRDISQLLGLFSEKKLVIPELMASCQLIDSRGVISGLACLSDDSSIPVEFSVRAMAVESVQQFIVTVIDVTHHKQAEEMLSQAFQLSQSIINNSPFSIAATDASGQVIAVSPALEKMLGYSKEELVYRIHIKMFLEPCQGEAATDLLLRSHQGSKIKALKKLMKTADEGGVGSMECLYLKKNGSSVPVNLTVTRLEGYESTLSGYLFVAYDITKKIRAQKKIEFIAQHDELTRLPNRVLMRDRLKHALDRMKRYGGKVGLVLLDLDHFKRINDSLGHQTGDELLQVVSKRLVKNVRATDTVCRLGGDEFVIILPDMEQSTDVEKICENLQKAITRPIKMGGHVLNVTPSIGYCVAPDNGKSASALLKNSDIAMYRAKRSGRNSFCAFLPEDGRESVEMLCMEQALREAIETNQLLVHYQPKVDLRTWEIVGFEALVRWEHSVLGSVSPQRFIPLAEATGLIVPLGEQVLRKACREIGELCHQHGKAYHVAVNFCPAQFESATVTDLIFKAVDDSRLPAGGLELEITEGMLMGDGGVVMEKLRQLRSRGIKITIDDFGTGFSNLAYVAKYPIDTIKIDRCFMNIDHKVNSAIINAITQIAEGLDLQVVAEGTESEAQLRFVQERGCHFAQGFYFSKAVCIKTLEEVIKENFTRTHLASNVLKLR